MGIVNGVADRCLGYLGLFLIGAISWMADRIAPAPEPAPRARARRIPPHSTRRVEA